MGGEDKTMTNDEYFEQGKQKLDVAIAAVNKIVDSMGPKTKPALKTMFGGPFGEQFFTAPASTRRAYHNAYPGGLVAHSLNVVRNAVKLGETMFPNRWTTEQLMFCALLHDVGKAGDGVEPFYVRSTGSYKWERGEFYELNRETQYMPSSEMGLYVLQRYGVTLTQEEYLALRLSDGPAAENNTMYKFREPDLAVLIHTADEWAMRDEKADAR